MAVITWCIYVLQERGERNKSRYYSRKELGLPDFMLWQGCVEMKQRLLILTAQLALLFKLHVCTVHCLYILIGQQTALQ